MLAVGLGNDEVSSYLRPGVTVGCVNSHRSITLTGDKSAVEQVHAQLQEGKIFSRRLRTGGKAYHSEHMKKVGGEYQRLIEPELGNNGLVSSGPTAMVSSIDGKMIKDEIPPSYWRRNLESPVRFDQAMESMIKQFNVTHTVEIGPHNTLQGPLKHILQRMDAQSVGYLFTMSRGESTPKTIIDLAGHLYIQGYPVALKFLNSQVTLGPPGSTLDITDPHTITDLPGYSWDHKLLWEENRLSYEFRNRPYPRHELLGSRLPYGGATELIWRNVLRPKDIQWLDDHKVGTIPKT
jgi:acyl transferase domain-containing protein